MDRTGGGGALVLDSSAGNLDGVTVGLTGQQSLLAVVWRKRLDAAQRLRGATVTLAGRVTGPADLTADGPESAFFPRFGEGADGVLRVVWDRRTSSAGRAVRGTGFGPPFAVPGRGTNANPAVVADPDATLVAVWLASSGVGNAVRMASRPRGGAFGAPAEIAAADQGAFAPRLVATSAGEVLVAWVNTASARGWGAARGVVRAQRLGGDERPVGARLRLSPNGARAIEPALAHDGTGNVIAAWTDTGVARARRVQVRRIAPGAIVGPVRTVLAGRRSPPGCRAPR